MSTPITTMLDSGLEEEEFRRFLGVVRKMQPDRDIMQFVSGCAGRGDCSLQLLTALRGKKRVHCATCDASSLPGATEEEAVINWRVAKIERVPDKRRIFRGHR